MPIGKACSHRIRKLRGTIVNIISLAQKLRGTIVNIISLAVLSGAVAPVNVHSIARESRIGIYGCPIRVALGWGPR